MTPLNILNLIAMVRLPRTIPNPRNVLPVLANTQTDLIRLPLHLEVPNVLTTIAGILRLEIP